jgi:hypothetical protein
MSEKKRSHSRSSPRAKSARSLPRFDPDPSMRAGLKILNGAGVPYALAGRLAVWMHVPPAGHQFTKDVDFAVPHGYLGSVAQQARRQGYRVTELNIGGFGIKGPRVLVDFIDRHPDLTQLFADAVGAARRQPKSCWLKFGGRRIPVVPREYLIAMKLIVPDPLDERDIAEMVLGLPHDAYSPVRRLVVKYLGHLWADRLDAIARSVGHPGPGMVTRYKRGN